MKKPSKKIFEEYLFSLSVDELTAYIKEYDTKNKTKVTTEINALKMNDLQQRLETLQITTYCPYCGTDNIKKNGKHGNIQRYLCKDCKKSFSLFSGTFLEGTNWSWEVWVKLLQMTINSVSFDKMVEILEKDFQLEGINKKTVFLARHKLLYAMSLMPKPILTGVIQVDETFFRENQKGTRTDKIDPKTGKQKELINVLPNIIEKRLPRYGRIPSRIGVLGPEYACAVCAVDNSGHAISIITSLGKLTLTLFTDCFDSYFENVTYLCTDGNTIYSEYCRLKQIPHYIRPSSYLQTLKSAGYILGLNGEDIADHAIPEKTANEIESLYVTNQQKMAELYKQGLLDKIEIMEGMPFQKFCELKKQNGLNLSRVNSFHNYLKLNIEKIMTGVGTKHLPSYVSAYTFIYNWKTDYSTTLASIKDAETVLINLLKTKSAFTLNDLENRDFFIAPTPTGRYLALLDKETRAIRRETDNKFFKFDEEDRVVSFDKKKYIRETPVGKLRPIGKQYKIKGYTRMSHWQLYNEIIKLKDLDKIVYQLIAQDKVFSIYAEDIRYMADNRISKNDLRYSSGSNFVDLERLHILNKDEQENKLDDDDLPF